MDQRIPRAGEPVTPSGFDLIADLTIEHPDEVVFVHTMKDLIGSSVVAISEVHGVERLVDTLDRFCSMFAESGWTHIFFAHSVLNKVGDATLCRIAELTAKYHGLSLVQYTYVKRTP